MVFVTISCALLGLAARVCFEVTNLTRLHLGVLILWIHVVVVWGVAFYHCWDRCGGWVAAVYGTGVLD